MNEQKERLTIRIADHVYYTKGKYTETLPAECETADVRNILQRLADHEDAFSVNEQKKQELKAEIESLRSQLTDKEKMKNLLLDYQKENGLIMKRLIDAEQERDALREESEKFITIAEQQGREMIRLKELVNRGIALREANTAMRKLLIEFAKPGNWGIEVNTYTKEWIGEGVPMEMATSILISTRERRNPS